MIKVVISSIWYPLCMARYFLAALQRRADVELFSVGPFTNTWLPWNGGMNLLPKYVYRPSLPLPQDWISFRPSASAIAAQLPWKPDLWLQVDAGWHFADKPKAGVVAHIGTDPHVLTDFYKPAKAYSDVCFGMQTPYLQPKDVFLPYAADPVWHSPMEGLPQDYDACLIGLHYPQRDRLVDYLRKMGLRVYYSLGEVYNEYQIQNCKATVALSWSSLKDTPARVYEAMSMSRILLANRTEDLTGQFVEGEHFLGFDNEQEAGEQIKRILKDENMREDMRWSAHRKIQAQHLWDHRVESILERCGLSHEKESITRLSK